MPGTSLLEHFSALRGPRQAGKVGYRLQEVLLVVLCGTMAGAENFVEIERWANRKLAFLRRPSVRSGPKTQTDSGSTRTTSSRDHTPSAMTFSPASVAAEVAPPV